MSKFYGTVDGDLTKTNGTNRGKEYIKASVQSYDGSIITKLAYEEDKLYVVVKVNDGSSDGTEEDDRIIFYGTFEDFKKRLEREL